MLSNKEFQALEKFNLDLTAGSAKKAMSELGASSADRYNVEPKDVMVVPRLNPRIRTPKHVAKIRWLADQMKLHGFYADKALACYAAVVDGKQVVYLQDGHGRHEAVLLAISEGAPITTVPVIFKDRSLNEVDRSIAMVASNGGTDWTPMEKSIWVSRFRAWGKPDGEIAQLLQCSPAYVGQLATLAGAPKKIRDMVIGDEISATNAIEALRKHGDKAAEVLSGALGKAKASGKTKASAKDDAASAALARQKKHGPALYEMVVALLEHKATVVPEEMQKDLDSLLFKIEDAGVKEVVASKQESLL